MPGRAAAHVASAGLRNRIKGSADRVPAAAGGIEPAAAGALSAAERTLRGDVSRRPGGGDPRAAGTLRACEGARLARLPPGTARAAGVLEHRGCDRSGPAGPSQLRQAADDLVSAGAGRALDRRIRE